MQYGGADSVIYGYALHKHGDLDSHAASLIKSKPDEMLAEGQLAGKGAAHLDQKAEREREGGGFHRAVTEKTFNLINGGQSSIVSDLVDENPEFTGAAGVTSAVLDLKKVEDHKRIQDECRDMVPDPNNPPGTVDMKGSKAVDFAKLHAATMDSIIYNRDLDGSDSLANKKKETEALYGEHAGLMSDKLASLSMTNIDDAEGWGLKMVNATGMHKGAAGRLGSTAVYETRSRRAPNHLGQVGVGGVDRAAEAFDFTLPPVAESLANGHRDVLTGMAAQQGGSTYQRPNFSHHSQSERVGAVVFGQEPPMTVDYPLTQPLMDTDGTVLGNRGLGAKATNFNGAAGSQSKDIYTDLQYKLDDQPARPRLHMMSEVDEVVFGHDVDGSAEFGEREWGGAGKSSKALQAGKQWKLRDVGRRENCGTVDEVVFGHDIDRSTSLVQETQLKAAAGPQNIRAAGASSMAVLSAQHLNDPRARMHYPPECYKHSATGNEETVDQVVFAHAMDTRVNPNADDDVIFPVFESTKSLIQGSSGNKSGDLNRHNPKISMQRKQMVPIYDSNRAEVDEIIYGRDLDPPTYTEEDVERLQYLRAGKSSVTKELEVRSESKKIVPHEHGHALALLFPEDGDQQVSRAAEERGNVQFDQVQAAEMAAGNSSVHNAHLKFRELEFVDGAVGTRKGRAAGRESNGAAGKKINKEATAMQTKARIPTVASPVGPAPGGRPFGKPSGLKAHSESSGVASALNQPLVQPPPGSSAYEEALSQGRALLEVAYTDNRSGTASGIKVDKSRTSYVAPMYNEGDSAGNYRKETRPLVSKPRPEGKFGDGSPFGVDPVTPATTNARFSASSHSIGGIKKDRIVPYAVVEEHPLPSKASTAIVPTGVAAAGQRPK
eukprot:7308445-Prymnesium_polylepis.1